jgi:hypothetical protein
MAVREEVARVLRNAALTLEGRLEGPRLSVRDFPDLEERPFAGIRFSE